MSGCGRKTRKSPYSREQSAIGAGIRAARSAVTGIFLSAIAATPVYKLFGEKGVETNEMPKPNDTSLLMNKLGYYMHDGGHSVLPQDWTHFIEYMKKHL